MIRRKELEALKVASRSGMIDMYGDLIPAIDGCNSSMICSVVNLMREIVDSSLKLKETFVVNGLIRLLNLDF